MILGSLQQFFDSLVLCVLFVVVCVGVFNPIKMFYKPSEFGITPAIEFITRWFNNTIIKLVEILIHRTIDTDKKDRGRL